MIVVFGVDAHKRTHTVVAADEAGAELARTTVAATSEGHLDLLRWAEGFGQHRWAIEDCRHLSRRLETDLVVAGERVLRVPPKMMAATRRGARTRGKSDPIDALAVARAALSEPGLPAAHLDGPARQLRLLVDYRETLISQRTAAQSRLRWHLHELQAGWDPPARSLDVTRTLNRIEEQLTGRPGTVADLARRYLNRIRDLTREAADLEKEITRLVADLTPTLLSIPGCGPLTAAKLIGEAADISRFHSRDAYAMWAGTAPIPVWSANTQRYRLNRGGNRQTNTALHRIAITQIRCHPDAQTYLKHRLANGNTKTEAIRALKRHLANTIYRALQHDNAHHHNITHPHAA